MLNKSLYYVEVSVSDGKKVLWELVDDTVVEEGKDNYEIGPRGFGFNLFGKDEEGVVREGLSEYKYLLILINIWPGEWKNQLEMMNIKV